MTDTLKTLLDGLDGPQATFTTLDSYYSGTQPLAFLSPESKAALGDRFGRMAINYPRLAITSLAERLRVTGFDGVDVAAAWVASNMDQKHALTHREALTLGTSYVLVWGDRAGRPVISPESAKQVATLTDPGSGDVTAAIKRWTTSTTTEVAVYFPDRIERHRAPSTGATAGGFRLVETIPNPLGVVPVVPFVNADRLLADGTSEILDLIPPVDALNKTLADLLVTSESTARPRRWATGLELGEVDVLDADGNPTGETEAVNPIPENDRTMVSEDHETKFGQLPGADLAGYRQAVDILLGQIMAVSALPSHYVGITSSNPASADALRASEAALTARAEARASSFGVAWERVADLAAAVADGGPVQARARVQWQDPSTRSIAQQADAVVKLYGSGLLPATYALKRLGYTPDEIDAIREDRQLEAIDRAAADVLTGGAA